MIIDAHIHVGAWDHADFLGRENDVPGTLAVLRDAGVSGAVLMPSDRREHARLRDDMLRAIDGGWRGPLWHLAWVRPGEEGASDLAWVRAHRKDCAGLKIHPSLSRVRLSDDGFRPALELAAELDCAVLVHCGRWQDMAGWSHALDAAMRYPSVRFVLAHAGGDTPPLATGAARAVAERKLDNVWFEWSGLREYWVVENNVRLLGAERYLLGSDFPLAHPLSYLGALRGMALDDRQRALMAGENALRVFGAPMAGSL